MAMTQDENRGDSRVLFSLGIKYMCLRDYNQCDSINGRIEDEFPEQISTLLREQNNFKSRDQQFV